MASVMSQPVSDRTIVIRVVTYVGFGVVRTIDQPIRPVVVGK